MEDCHLTAGGAVTSVDSGSFRRWFGRTNGISWEREVGDVLDMAAMTRAMERTAYWRTCGGVGWSLQGESRGFWTRHGDCFLVWE